MRRYVGMVVALGFLSAVIAVASPPGEKPALGARITQAKVESGDFSLLRLRVEGRRIFSTPFNRLDGFGDGPVDASDTTSPGGRPLLQNNGTFLRVNGLDAQTCLECHSFLSNAVVPFTFAPGGHGGSNNSAMGGAKNIDVDDEAKNGFAAYDGRFINPPFLFGSGGIELLGKEMTAELQAIKKKAKDDPDVSYDLIVKGVDFGTIAYKSGAFDTSEVEGIDDDCVVRPFGRKGEFTTVRAFDTGALRFHHGMEPVEAVGEDVDNDGDGVTNEILVGENSVMHIFGTTMEKPRETKRNGAAGRGFDTFKDIGCAECHIPALETDSRYLTYSFPEIATDPSDNVYLKADLSKKPTGFKRAPGYGIVVPCFADLKRHDMGDDLAESTGGELDPFFTTARLWGVADTPPYLHDGRALTLTDAILMHGGEAEDASDDFAALSDTEKEELLAFLRTLRTPKSVGKDLDFAAALLNK